MRKFQILTALAAALLVPQFATAEDGPRRGDRPGPEVIFQHLDANNDGALTREEAPPRMQERFDDLLAKADKNNDKKLDQAEFSAAANELRPRDGEGRPPFAGPRGMRERGPIDRSPGDMSLGRPDKQTGRPDFDRADGPKRPHGPRPEGMGPMGFGSDGAYLLFMRMDQDQDGRLTPHEFIKGMETLHRFKAHRVHFGGDHATMEPGNRPHDLRGVGPLAQRGPWEGPRHPGKQLKDRDQKACEPKADVKADGKKADEKKATEKK